MKLFTKFFCFAVSGSLLISNGSKAQVSFINANSKLTSTDIHSGCPATVVDVNGDGLDDIVRLDQAHLLYIDYQRPGLQFDHHYIGNFGGDAGWAWAMCVADVDHNGYKDVLAGGYGPAVKIFKLNSTGTSGTLYSLDTSFFFLQNANFADINNDGWEDIFACDDDAESHIWLNNGNGNFTVSHIIDFDVTNTDDSGNYGSVWTDFDNDGDVDLYIAKCRQGVASPSDGRRIDVLFENDGNNNYTSNAAEYGLADSAETWTCNFADIDNDGDLDAIQTDYDVPAKLLENDGTGHMTNITNGSGFVMNIAQPLESVMEDFDNDGFVDILVSGTSYNYFHNNGNHTFTKLPVIFGTDNMASFAIGDLNHDGKVDVYASYAIPYTTPSSKDDVYWLNSTNNGNHFLTLNLIGTASNEGALGARAEIYGAWGKQLREVHAGESYGTCNTSNLHFGLGTATDIDSVVIRWPSGAVKTIVNPAIDQFMTVKEDACVSPDLVITYTGTTILCPGQSLMLTASDIPADYAYLWSDGSTTQSITVNTSGDYSVHIASSSNDCYTTAAAISVIQNPDQTPAVTVTGDLTFCSGGSVTLAGPAGTSYNWSNGETTQAITVTESGSYSLTTPGTCQSWTSPPVVVTVLESAAPVSSDVYLSAPGSATLSATGDEVSWYDVPTGGVPLSTGNTFVTPTLTETTTYYAENGVPYGADTLYVGPTSHEGSLYSGSSNTNSDILFEVMKPCTIKTVKVYTNIPGNRLIELRASNGNVLQSAMINVPMDSSRITLNFSVTPGNYQLGTNSAQNVILLGSASPHLERSDDGVSYPYVLDDLVSLNGSDQGSGVYYYFYDWEVVKSPTICISDRTPVTVFVEGATGIPAPASIELTQLFPNPTQGAVTLTSATNMNGKVMMQLTDVTGHVLLSRVENGWKNGEQFQLDLSAFAKGIYMLNIKTDDGVQEHKIVVQ